MYRRSFEDWEPRGRSRAQWSHGECSGRSRSRSKHRIGGLLAGVGLAALLARRLVGCLDRDRDGGRSRDSGRNSGYGRRDSYDRGYGYGYGYGGYDYDRRDIDRRASWTSSRRESWDGRDGGRARSRRPERERERKDRSWDRRSDRHRDSWGYEPRRSPSRSSMRSSSSRKPGKRVHWAI